MGTRFENHTALVTGGTSGMGAAIACGLHDEGAKVVAAGLEGAVEEGNGLADRGITIRPLDVSNAESVNALAAEFSELDILINAAGIIRRNRQEFEMDSFARVVEVNLNGTMHMCTACHSALVRRRGAVVNVGSLYSFFGAAHAPAYSASKGAVVQLTKSLAAAWAGEGIRVNAVVPGWIETTFTQAVQGNDERRRSIIDRTPMGRWGKPEDVVGPVLFLCSDAAGFVTGVALPVDGGFSIS